MGTIHPILSILPIHVGNNMGNGLTNMDRQNEQDETALNSVTTDRT